MSNLSIDMHLVFPELFLAATGLILLMAGVFLGDRSTRSIIWTAMVGFAATLFLVTHTVTGSATAFNGIFISDQFAIFMKSLTLAGAICSLFLSQATLIREELNRPEFPALVIFAVLGMMIMISANDFLAMYLGLELQSLSLYVLAAFRRDVQKSSEAGLKYFVLGSLSSGLLLYGISLVYGFSGTTSFSELANILPATSKPALGLIIGLVFIIAGLAFKVSAVPFHMWTPDVYEGAPTSVTAFFAIAPKMAAIALFARVLFEPFGHLPIEWQQIVWILAVASMIVGSLGALAQNNIKRLMGYSAIANIGFALIGLAAGTTEGIQGVIIYMAIYLVATIGSFGVILLMQRKGELVETIPDLAGLSRSQKSVALAMLIFMFSFAGIPPLAGFFGKLYVFNAAINADLPILAVIGVLTSVISACYYLRIVKIMYFDNPAVALDRPSSWEMSTILIVSSLLTLFFFLYPSPLIDQATLASLSLKRG